MQPAFYEAFGLTVVEAMTCGLPTFATCHGGPAEIIEHGISGFHVDPYHPDHAGELMADFFERCQLEPKHWDEISNAGLQRIYDRSVVLDRLIVKLVLVLGSNQKFAMINFTLSSNVILQVHLEDLFRKAINTSWCL